jgi:hypothetical protein
VRPYRTVRLLQAAATLSAEGEEDGPYVYQYDEAVARSPQVAQLHGDIASAIIERDSSSEEHTVQVGRRSADRIAICDTYMQRVVGEPLVMDVHCSADCSAVVCAVNATARSHLTGIRPLIVWTIRAAAVGHHSQRV